jgi:hypothetical protein
MMKITMIIMFPFEICVAGRRFEWEEITPESILP